MPWCLAVSICLSCQGMVLTRSAQLLGVLRLHDGVAFLLLADCSALWA